MGVNKKKFSRLTSVTSTLESRPSPFSNSMATVSPPKPLPRMSTRFLRGEYSIPPQFRIKCCFLSNGDAKDLYCADLIQKLCRSYSQDSAETRFLHDRYD